MVEVVVQAAVRRGDESLPCVSDRRVASFQALYQEHFAALSRYCASLVNDRETGAELAQEAFARLFARWRTVRRPRPWLFYVGTVLATDHWRLSQRDAGLVSRLGALRPLDTVTDTGSELRQVVESLPPELRQVVLLYYYADLPVAEIATLVRRPAGTVKRRLHEARALLAAALEER